MKTVSCMPLAWLCVFLVVSVLPSCSARSSALLSSTHGFKLFGLTGGGSGKMKTSRVSEADTAREFDNLIWGHQDDLVVVDFSATWCGPCKAIAPVYDAISIEKQNRNIMFIKVDVDKNPEIAARYGVKSMPTFLFLKNRKELDRFSGANIVKLKETILNLK